MTEPNTFAAAPEAGAAPILPVTADVVAAAVRRARAAGALTTVATDHRRIVDGGMPFVIRRVSSLADKDAPRPAGPAAANPFLPPDPALAVAGLGPTHVCLLNKYSVVPGHLLIVTRAFAAQEALLDLADFVALSRVLGGLDGLGFYNAGPVAGASQAHKHLQVVPLPLAPPGCAGDPPVPLQRLIDAAGASPSGRLPGLPFRHALRWIGVAPETDPAAAAATWLDGYRALLAAVGLVPRGGSPTDGTTALRPYNLLVTRQWMLVVPRRRAAAHGIAVNALGFAGSLFVRDADQLATVERLGPLAVLAAVAEPAGSAP